MNAPFAWPPTYPLPQFRSKRVAIVSLGVLLASCSDGLTSPGERKPASPTPSSASRVGADVVIMERVTTDAAHGGEAPVVHTSREVLTPQVRSAATSFGVRTLSAAPSGPVRPPVFLPARREVAICNALPTWTDVSRGAGGRNVEVSGIGDAPASTIRVAQADGSFWTIERTWTRTTTSWQLDRQVTSGANGYRDVVTYHHQDALGHAVNNALPVSTCTGQKQLVGPASVAASRSFYPSYSGALYSKLVPGAGVTAEDGCWDIGGDPCYDKRIAVYKDDIAVATMAMGVTVACVTPVVVAVIPCVTATTLYAAAVATLALDYASLQHCLDGANKPTPELSVTTGAPSARTTSPGHLTLGASTVGATTLADCGSSIGTTPSALHCRWDTWEISYDGGNTWQYFGSFLICDSAL